MKVQKKIHTNQKQFGPSILILGKVDCKAEALREKEMTAVHSGHARILNLLHQSNLETSKARLTELQGEIDKSAILGKDLELHLLVINRSSGEY